MTQRNRITRWLWVWMWATDLHRNTRQPGLLEASVWPEEWRDHRAYRPPVRRVSAEQQGPQP